MNRLISIMHNSFEVKIPFTVKENLLSELEIDSIDNYFENSLREIYSNSIEINIIEVGDFNDLPRFKGVVKFTILPKLIENNSMFSLINTRVAYENMSSSVFLRDFNIIIYPDEFDEFCNTVTGSL